MAVEQTATHSGYFFNIALKYREQVEAILREGKTIASLRDGEAFMTVPYHCIIVASICDSLGKMTGLDGNTQENLNKTAILHDADKRLEIKPNEFSENEKAKLQEKLTTVGLDKKLLPVTKEKFVEDNKNNVGNLSLPQMILYYADMLVSWRKIVPFKDRIEESASRRPDLPDEFFETELAFGKAIEKRIFDKLPDDIREQIKTPDQIPNFLVNKIYENS
jgi:hypothetical protein